MITPENYNKICLKIWGCIPLDWKWAIQTNIFKREQLNISWAELEKANLDTKLTKW